MYSTRTSLLDYQDRLESFTQSKNEGKYDSCPASRAQMNHVLSFSQIMSSNFPRGNSTSSSGQHSKIGRYPLQLNDGRKGRIDIEE